MANIWPMSYKKDSSIWSPWVLQLKFDSGTVSVQSNVFIFSPAKVDDSLVVCWSTSEDCHNPPTCSNTLPVAPGSYHGGSTVLHWPLERWSQELHHVYELIKTKFSGRAVLSLIQWDQWDVRWSGGLLGRAEYNAEVTALNNEIYLTTFSNRSTQQFTWLKPVVSGETINQLNIIN